MREVAAAAGLSIGTVSNALNQPGRVSPAALVRVQRAIDELGFVPNESARALPAGRSQVVGALLQDVSNPFFTDVARGAEEVVLRKGGRLALFDSAVDTGRESRHLEYLEQQRVQGVILCPVGPPAAALAELQRREIPVVLVDRNGGQHSHCSVSVDDVLGGGLAAQHLLDQGHQRLAFVGGPEGASQMADRLRGAQGAVAAVPGSGMRVLATEAATVAAGREAGTRLCASSGEHRPTGVVCGNDLLALGVLQAAMAGRLRVPYDLAIVGYDDIEFAAAAAVPLTSVHQPRHQLGRTAAELLYQELESGPGHRHRQVVFAPELRSRESTMQRRTPAVSYES